MLIDTHCHINMMVKNTFDVPLDDSCLPLAQTIINDAHHAGITTIINVGTSLVESMNCVLLAQRFNPVYAAIGIHPNDATDVWHNDFDQLRTLVRNKGHNKIVAIGETGLDRHYPEYNLPRQIDAFKAQINLALENNLGLIVHTRDAAHETLAVLEEYATDLSRCVIHCFSEQQDFAHQVTAWGFFIGLGGAITYPKNEYLRNIARTTPLEHIVLETDAPFLPPQIIRGKQNSPAQIRTIAHYLADLRETSLETVASQTTMNAQTLFALAPVQ